MDHVKKRTVTLPTHRQKTMTLKYALYLNAFLSLPLHAQIIEAPVPGGIKKIAIASKTPPAVYLDGKRVAVQKGKHDFTAIVGIPLSAKGPQLQAQQRSPHQKRYSFTIHKKPYQIQRLTIKNKRKVTPLPEDTARIEKEQRDFDKTLAVWTNNKTPFATPFIAPIRGPITSTFGLQRIYNDIPKAPHTALDIAAPLGTPIKATANGRIINVHHRFYTGNTVIIDHGQGVMSLYAHLDGFNVKNGQWVNQGDVIGTVGKTGRVTGPHLHWAIYLNQTSVDPLLFISRKAILPPAIKTKNNV